MYARGRIGAGGVVWGEWNGCVRIVLRSALCLEGMA